MVVKGAKPRFQRSNQAMLRCGKKVNVAQEMNQRSLRTNSSLHGGFQLRK
jgi:hypothetical protein